MWTGFTSHPTLNANLCHLANYNLVLISVTKKNQRDNFLTTRTALHDYEMAVIFVKNHILSHNFLRKNQVVLRYIFRWNNIIKTSMKDILWNNFLRKQTSPPI